MPETLAILSGIPPHLLSEDIFAATLGRMGLDPGAMTDGNLADIAARHIPIGLAARAFDLFLIDADADIAARFTGHHPGAEGRLFTPTPGPLLGLRWLAERTPSPRAGIDPVLTMMAMLNAFFFARFILWYPARLWTHAPAFANAVEKYVGGDLLPVLRLAAFDEAQGAAATIVTRGLAPFTGQELRAETGVLGPVETTRRLARLALDMFDHGAVARATTIDGLEPGERIVLTPREKAGDTPGTVAVTIARSGD